MAFQGPALAKYRANRVPCGEIWLLAEQDCETCALKCFMETKVTVCVVASFMEEERPVSPGRDVPRCLPSRRRLDFTLSGLQLPPVLPASWSSQQWRQPAMCFCLCWSGSRWCRGTRTAGGGQGADSVDPSQQQLTHQLGSETLCQLVFFKAFFFKVHLVVESKNQLNFKSERDLKKKLNYEQLLWLDPQVHQNTRLPIFWWWVHLSSNLGRYPWCSVVQEYCAVCRQHYFILT